jgi:ABC-type iron transport system FetAB ATPase subunit
MAVIPLNTFRTIARNLTTTNEVVLYTCPAGVTAIVLLAQVANVDAATTGRITFMHVRQTTKTELVKNCPVPIEDARTMLTGRLVLEEGDRLNAVANAANRLKITLSVVESANT